MQHTPDRDRPTAGGRRSPVWRLNGVRIVALLLNLALWAGIILLAVFLHRRFAH